MLSLVELAINSSASASTGKAPSELVFGARIALPLDVMLGADVTNDSAADVDTRVT